MAREIRAFQAVIPAGTAKATPVTIDMSFPPRKVLQVDIRVPPGPNGTVGFQLANSGTQIIPAQAGAFVVTSDESIPWPLVDYVQSGSWQLIGYNTGNYQHTIYVRFQLDVVQNVTPSPVPAVLPVSLISPLPDAVPAGSVNVGNPADFPAAGG